MNLEFSDEGEANVLHIDGWPRTHHHGYYALRANDLVVLAVWGAAKERGPRL